MSKLTGLAAIVKGGGEMEPQQIELEDTAPAFESDNHHNRPAPKKQKPQAKVQAPAKAWTRGGGKSSNPAYARLSVYVPTALRIQAERKWEDATGKDASDLVEHLLSQYVRT